MSDISFNIVIEETSNMNDSIYDLLLLADPSQKIVDEYIVRGKVFVANYCGNVVGEYVLINTRPETVEVINIAIKEEYQRKGLGKLLLKDAISRASMDGAKVLEIGTANSSIFQLALYQKVGFRITGIDRDFFIKHYDEPIYENGIQCIDMIRLSMDLKENL
ncbi:Acetyltransferase (GNAT) family protein [Tindallia magadiensis]|uniref:Probable N-acetyltransferase 14 n=1 Tax=Tindallia magadiensis TaxID=69895 RepID=A0A1I3I5V5_9FIRM|nr:GNAT family N-acetyltransferase [Tindallia magadiensis]SFI43301.1 Acetyltransferase (GNAT) family protein [Tindallia magadiensis]